MKVSEVRGEVGGHKSGTVGVSRVAREVQAVFTCL